MYHRSVFEAVGGFDEGFDAAEDVEFNYRLERAGYRCFTSAKLAIHYYPRSSVGALFRQLKRYGYGRAAFLLKHPERFTLETLVPAGFVLSISILAAASLISKIAAFALGIGLGLYAIILGFEALRLGGGKPHLAFRFPVVIATIHCGLGIGFIQGLIQRRDLWKRDRLVINDAHEA
jgi:GT2 family glycosyltransferase